jgi:hypothetical protein
MAATTTIVTDDGLLDAELAEATARPHVSWASIFVGAVVAVATTLFLLLLGSGIGLALVNPARAASGGAHFLTLGAIYFLAAQAFGLALGGHLTGRLIGPVLETSSEEEFRAGAHGLAVWGLAVITSALLVAVSGLVAENAAVSLRAAYGASALERANSVLPATTGYWVDVLFRPSAAATNTNTHASLAGVQYAQNDTGTATDANPAPPPPSNEPASGTPQSNAPPNPPPESTSPSYSPPSTYMDQSGTSSPPPPRDSARRPPVVIQIPQTGGQLAPSGEPGASTLPPLQSTPHDIQADKAEVGRILNIGMAHGAFLSPDDRGRIAELVAQDANLSYEAATARANDVQSRIHDQELRNADTTRRLAEYASLWTALALLFGAVVATVAAISARWQDDAQQMFVMPWLRGT